MNRATSDNFLVSSVATLVSVCAAIALGVVDTVLWLWSEK